jgi:uncharacterized protein (TIGR02246 family)
MSDIDRIRECTSEFDEALKVGDGDRCASCFIPDGIMMPPNSPLVQGREAISKHFTDLGPDSSVAGDILKTEISGDLAYMTGRVTWESEGGTKYTDTLDVLQMQAGGSWLYVISTWNSEEGLDQE